MTFAVIAATPPTRPLGTQVATVDQPAAGHDWTWNAPGTWPTKVVAVTAELVTSATAGSRWPELRYQTRDAKLLGRVAVTTNVGASKTAYLAWQRVDGVRYSEVFATATHLVIPVVDVWMPPGSTVKVVTANLSVTDQWSTIVVAYEVGQW